MRSQGSNVAEGWASESCHRTKGRLPVSLHPPGTSSEAQSSWWATVFSVCASFWHQNPQTPVRIFTLDPNYRSFTSCIITPFQTSLGKWILKAAICLLKICEEARHAAITNASVTGFVLCVHGKKITCGVSAVLLGSHGILFWQCLSWKGRCTGVRTGRC